MLPFSRCLAIPLAALSFLFRGAFGEEPALQFTLDLTQRGKLISPDLVGVFFEDINYAADGGLYAELIQNRSFEYGPTEQRSWNPLTCWELVKLEGGEGALELDAGQPVHRNNPHYAVLDVSKVGGGVGVWNAGFDGIALQAGEAYEVSLFVRQLYLEKRWGGKPFGAKETFSLVARLEDASGKSLGETKLEYQGGQWQRVTGTITPERSVTDARLVIMSQTQGGMAMDEVSLFPRKTFRNRPNGLRNDLAEAIAALKPKFIRFPGGCLVHGNGLGNMYRWDETVGPTHERRQQANIWGYHQTMGLGYHEYFQFCEDIGAKPLPVVPAGVCCQNSGKTSGIGQDGLPLAEMPGYIREVLDLVEWATGPADSKWGAVRAAAGHPEPFELEYLGVGNEDHITPEFEDRFRLIHAALAAKHPELTVVGTVGPFPEGPDYNEGWRIANSMKLAVVDEHYYQPPDWFLKNLSRYDAYDRDRSEVYVGEYAAHEPDRSSTLRSALAEAAYLTHLERNGDVVRLASYAPLLAKQGHTQWRPDLIYFDNTQVCPTVNYFVQQLFSLHSGDEYFSARLEPAVESLAISTVRDLKTRDLILKLVNISPEVRKLTVELAGAEMLAPQAERTTLTGDPAAVNEFGKPRSVEPRTDAIAIGPKFEIALPAHSLTVVRMKTRGGE